MRQYRAGMSTADPLAPTWFLDHEHPDVRAFAEDTTGGLSDDADRAAALFAAVREEIRYDPYRVDLRREAMRASAVLTSGRNWCVPKATLLAAACRAAGLPAWLGYADVRNHLSSAKLEAAMGTDVFAWHGFTVIEVDGERHKASPAFNAELCQRFGVEPLEFDGTADALLHAYDGEGRRHMEYLRERGVFDDVPLDQILATFGELYADMPVQVDGATGAQHDPAFHGEG